MPNQNTIIGIELNEKKDYIEQLLRDGYSVSEISKILSYGYAAVYNAIQRNGLNHYVGVHNNGKSLSSKLHFDKLQKFTKDELTDLYHSKKLNLYEIAEMYNMCATNVLYNMRKFGISTRTKTEAIKLLYERKPELREVHRKNAFDGITGIHKKQNRQNTWIEKEFENFCIEKKIPYKKQYQINGKGHRYDFKIYNKILVELDGEYWHSSEKQKLLDERFGIEAETSGYILVRFNDKIIKKTKGKCFNELGKYDRRRTFDICKVPRIKNIKI